MGTFIEASKGSENNRSQDAAVQGKLKKWQDETAGVPDKAKLTDLFGQFHYGWVDQPSVADTESV